MSNIAAIDTVSLLRQLKARLSLRTPQADSLEILDDVLKRFVLSKIAEPKEALSSISSAYGAVTDFERDFPSLCFALATGVGKTRLMGAFIGYLFLSGRSRHFFVLAPNKTIYDKLIGDFNPSNEKYVFKGVAELAQAAPVVVTGDTWDKSALLIDASERNAGLIINIFNVDKINKDGGRIKQLHEYIGESYFDYLASLPDLVLLMDESHRYRGKAGWRAVGELRPVLGLELTATPRAVGTKSERFRNVIFDYSLGQAMLDGYVKEPAVATRENFRADSVTPEKLERIKLEDGIHCHENVKAELEIYAQQSGRKKVHPFMLVVAQDTAHAEELRRTIEADDFFGGRYKGRVIRVDSATKGEESEEATERLLTLEESTDTDVVIHVNKLKEGWDVRNLYTIVPLRASASDILTEQTLGRGLRLPYGTRTGVDAVDTLTIIAHDRFDDVIKAARDPNSVIAIRKTVIVGASGDVSAEGATVLQSPTILETTLTGNGQIDGNDGQGFLFETAEERSAADITLQLIRDEYEKVLTKGIGQLSDAVVKARITADVTAALTPKQGSLEGVGPTLDVARIVEAVTAKVIELNIEIPEIVILPTREVTLGFNDFNLTGLESIARQPVSDQIMVQKLRDESRITLARSVEGVREERMENYLVRYLMDRSEVDYDSQSELLFKLAGQVVARLRSYLADEDDVENVLLVHGQDLARFVFEQMKKNYWETPTDYQAKVSRGFTLLRPQAFNVPNGSAVRDHRQAVVPAGDTKKHVFGGFNKCCYPYQKFDSSEERAFAALIDSPNEPSVVRWMKPGRNQFKIEYSSGHNYEPDFVIETTNAKFIVEVKAANEMDNPTVAEKTRAAVKWIGFANEHARQNGGKQWSYSLVPADAVLPSATLDGLVARYMVGA